MTGRVCSCHGEHGECSRCGSYICPACRRWIAERPHCAACVERIGRKPSARAMVAIALSTLGLACLPTGVLGAALGLVELRAIRRRESAPAGESFARVAIGLGIVETVAMLAWALFAAFASAP